jgi:hypothetical protein
MLAMLLVCSVHELLCHGGCKCVARDDRFARNAVRIVLSARKVRLHAGATTLVRARGARDGARRGELGISADRACVVRHVVAFL